MKNTEMSLLSEAELSISILEGLSIVLDARKQENKKNGKEEKFTKPRSFSKYIISNDPLHHKILIGSRE